MKLETRLVAPVFLAIALVCGLSSVGWTEDSIDEMVELRSGLSMVERPNLDVLDPTVASQLTKAREEMEAAVADPRATTTQLASAYGALGQIYHAYELLDAARQCYANSIYLEPQNFAWYHLQGDVSRMQDRLEDSLEEFTAARTLEPNDFAAVVNIANALLELEETEQARDMYRQALAMAPGSPSVMAGLGKLALHDKEFEDAVAYFTAALAAFPEANRLHYSLAMAYRGLGKVDEAKSHLKQRGTVGIRPPDPLLAALVPLREGERVHLVRGRMAFAAERYGDAKTEFELAVRADPQSVRSLVNLGAAMAKLGDPVGAAEQFEKALRLDDENVTANFNLGIILTGRGDFDEATSHLQKAADKEANDAEIQLALARCLVATGKDLDAIPYFRHSAELNPGNPATVVEGAATAIRLGRYKEAVSVLEAGLSRHPENLSIEYALARLLAACPDAGLRNGERALRLALALQDLDPKPQNAQLLAQALAEVGECKKAAKWTEGLIAAARRDEMNDVAEVLQADLEYYRNGPPCRPPMEDVSE